MMQKNKIILILFFTIHICFSQKRDYGVLTFNKAVNISGKQRMLTQRMGKIYLYLLDHKDDAQAAKDLNIAMIIFEKQLSILEKNTTSFLTKNRLIEVRDSWEGYKYSLESYPNEKDAIDIIKTNSTILTYANDVVNAIISESKKETSGNAVLDEEDLALKEIINKSGRQRMLSQRLALYYFANTSILKRSYDKEELENVFIELDDALNELLVSNFNNHRIDKVLGDVMVLWEKVKLDKTKFLKRGFENSEIYDLSNQLTTLFNKLTALYERIKLSN